MNNNNSIQVFDYEDFTVRTYTDDDGNVWFVAKDVCDVLGIANARDAITALDEDERNTVEISDGNRGNPIKNVISESGLYALVFRSNKPEVKQFSKWVRSEVLPAIRKTGCYSLPEKPVRVIKSRDKKPLPQTSAPIKAADKIYTKAFKAKSDKDFLAVLALDRIFYETFGRSALEDAGLQIRQTLVEVPVSYKELLDMPRERTEYSKWVNAYVLVRDEQIISSSVDEARK